MDYHNHYKYYIDHNFYIIKSQKIHAFLFLIDYLMIYLSIIDEINGKFIIDKKKKLYSPPNIFSDYLYKNCNEKILFIILTCFIVLNCILYFLYFYIFKNRKIINVYINYNEIFYMRFFSIFIFSIYFKFREVYLLCGIIISISLIVILEIHFNFYHCDFFTPKFIQIPFDYYSKIYDQILLISKFLISFPAKNPTTKNLSLTLLVFILTFLTFYILYIRFSSPIYTILNYKLNSFRFSFHISIYFLFICMICHKNIDLFSFQFIIFEISVFLCFIILIYIAIIYPVKPKLKYNSDLNIYYYFLYYFNKNSEKQLDFYNSFQIHYEKCKKCLLCKNYKIKTDFSYLVTKNCYFFLMKLIMNEYFSSGINGLKEKKQILIYILIVLSFPTLEHRNLYQYLTLFSIYKLLINLNNENVTNVKLLVNELEHVNKFISTASNLILKISELFTIQKKRVKVESILEVNDLSYDLKKINFKKFYSSNSKMKDILYQLTICTIIYEELFNVPLNRNDLIQIREHYQDLEDTLNLFDINKQFTFEFNIFTREITIIRSGKEFYKYLYHRFCELFPKDLFNYQKNMIKNKIYSLEETKEQVYLKSLKLIIRNPFDKKLINVIKLKFNVLVQKSSFNIIILDGVYKIYPNIIITYINEDKELFYGCGFDIPKSSRRNVSTYEDFIRLNKIKTKEIQFESSFTNGNIMYKIYKYGQDNLKDDDNNIIGTGFNNESNHSLYVDIKTVGESSMKSSQSGNSLKDINAKFNYRGKNFLQSAKSVNIKFYLYQRIIIIFIFVLFILTIIQLVIKMQYKTNLMFNYETLSTFRKVSKTYFYLISTFRGTTCLILLNHTECINYLKRYNEKLHSLHDNVNWDIIKYFNVSNKYNVAFEIEQSNLLWKNIYKSNDDKIHKFFSDEFNLYDITNISENGYISIAKTKSDFHNVFKTTINSFTILAYDDSYILEPYFVLDFPNNQLLNYINVERKEWRIELYNIMYNYEKICENFETITSEFSLKLEDQLNEYIELTIIFLVINFLIELIEVFLIIVYLYTFENVLFDIYEFIRKKVQNSDFNDAYMNKINDLKILTCVYSTHPRKILDHLNEVYLNYEKSKNKNDEEYISKKNYEIFKKSILKEISETPISVFSRYVYQFTFIFSLLMFIVFLFKWINQLESTLILFRTLNDSGLFELNAYQYYSLYQRSLYTTTNINTMKNYKNLLYTVQTLLQGQNFYRIIANESKISHTLLKFKQTANSCEEFYNDMQDENFLQVIANYPNDNFTQKIIEVCKACKFFDYTDYNFQNQRSFGLIYRGMMSVSQLTNENRENFFLNDDFYETTYFNYLFFKPMRSQINEQMFNPSIKYYMNQITILFAINSIIEFIYEFLFLIIVVFMLVIRLNNLYKKILGITKIIKINPDDNSF